MKTPTALTLIYLLTLFSITAAAEDGPSGMAGTVVNTEGNAVPNFSFALIPIHFDGWEMVAAIDEDELTVPALTHVLGITSDEIPVTIVQTDAMGAFSVDGIPPRFFRLWPLRHIEANTLGQWRQLIKDYIDKAEGMPGSILQNMAMKTIMPDKRIVSLQIGEATLFEFLDLLEETSMSNTELAFMPLPAETTKNMKVKVTQRLRIHARVLFADGTPVTYAPIKYRQVVNALVDDTIHKELFTDADGYFTYYTDTPGRCRVTVEYHGLTGGADSFQLDKNTPAPKNIVIALNGNKSAVSTPPDYELNLNLNPDFTLMNPKAVPFSRDIPWELVMPKKQELQKEGVWVVNPENGHGYKKIPCKDWQDAQQKALEQGAHLVSISDAAEQAWLYSIFGEKKTPFWIGLNDAEKEGNWEWDSGEPVSYTHWSVGEISHTDAEKYFVSFTEHNFGSWQAVSKMSQLWGMTRYAVIEKDGLVSKISKPQMENE